MIAKNSIPMKKSFSIALIWTFLVPYLVNSQPAAQTAPSTQWFEEASYGLFLHFGLYALPGGVWQGKNYYGCSEWLQRRARIPVAEYEQLATAFNPTAYDADAWVRFAKDCGFKYIVITTKHHDGFAMFHSKVSTFNIVDGTPFKRDVIKELADACKRHGMKLGFYYSQSQDWHEADAIGNDWDFDSKARNFQKYLDEKCKPQLEELLTNYGDVAILWFDTPQEITKAESQQLVDWVHQFQPNCLTSSRVGNGLGEYLALQDHNLPRNTIDRPFEALFTHNESWGYSQLDKNFRNPREILHLLLASNSRGGNLILNIGPKPDGTFQQESWDDFTKVGEWLRANGEAVYGAGPSPYLDVPWGYITTKPDALYLHLMEWPEDGRLRLPAKGITVKEASFLASRGEMSVTHQHGELLFELPATAPDGLCTVIKVQYSGELDAPDALLLERQFATTLYPEWATTGGNASTGKERWMEEFGDWHYATFVDGWRSATDQATWTLNVAQPGKYHVLLNYHYPSGQPSAEGVIRIDGAHALSFQSAPTGDQIRNFYEHRVGTIAIGRSGDVTLSISPLADASTFIKLQHVKLVPYE